MTPRAANPVRLNTQHHVATFISSYTFHLASRGTYMCDISLDGFAASCLSTFFFFKKKWSLGIQISERFENSTLKTADSVELRMQLTTTAIGRLCFAGVYVFIVFRVRALFFAFIAALRWSFATVGFVFSGFLVALVYLCLIGAFAYSARLLSLRVSTTASRAVPEVRVLGPTSP